MIEKREAPDRVSLRYIGQTPEGDFQAQLLIGYDSAGVRLINQGNRVLPFSLAWKAYERWATQPEWKGHTYEGNLILHGVRPNLNNHIAFTIANHLIAAEEDIFDLPWPGGWSTGSTCDAMLDVLESMGIKDGVRAR